MPLIGKDDFGDVIGPGMLEAGRDGDRTTIGVSMGVETVGIMREFVRVRRRC